ncbi:MAG TPA: mechanosensitive ion channel family protein [Acidimicrobiales bacterium]
MTVPATILSTTQPHLVATHGLTLWDWVHAAVIVVVAIALSQMVRRVTLRAFGTHSNRPAARISARFAAYLIAAGGLLYSLNALHVQVGPLVGALGIGGIALAFALQDILQNLVAGVILQARRPIRHGDQIEVGHYQGTVLDIDLRNVQIRTYDGLDVYLPNRLVLDGPIVNYTMSPLRRLALEIGIGYRSNLSDAQRCLLQAASSVDAVLAEPAPAAWVTEFGESSIKFSVLFWYAVADHTFWEVRSAVAVSIQQALRDAGIQIPYPIRTLEVDQSTINEIDLRQHADR